MNAMALGTNSSTDRHMSVKALPMSTCLTARVSGMMSLLSNGLRRPVTRPPQQHAGESAPIFPTCL
ncbi:hypothetical protein TPA0907_34030 [Micromonospora humidisoli]|nr:hypothetical protein TPA0907_34030 [Micromonospora sp. AKA109]